ncbi:MAG: hypothetical protein IJ075_02875 [Lachnospiraceae bacterium]|nr:hypothetical protein [Lachnospiraceae bacterium]MBQ9606459.1 hypothetical protein [Lachnospiraceae bacterium]
MKIRKTILALAVTLFCGMMISAPAYAGTSLELKDDEAYSAGGMSWNGSTLVLNNCSFSGQIKLPKNSTVTVTGTNNLIMNQIFDETGVLIGEGALTINGGGVLNIVNSVVTHNNCYGIVGKKELTISGVTINASAAAQGEADISAGIMARKAMKITGSTINATGAPNARTSAGIRGGKSIFIQSSNINASGTSFGIVSSGDALGISVSNVNAHGGTAAIKAKNAMQFAGVSGAVPGEKNDRWYAMSGSDRATDVKLYIS